MNFLSSIIAWFKGLFAPGVSSSLVVDIQAATVTLCKFLPLAQSVEVLVAKSNPTAAPDLTVVATISSEICNAISATKPAMPAAFISNVQPTSYIVNGVPIQGRFVA